MLRNAWSNPLLRACRNAGTQLARPFWERASLSSHLGRADVRGASFIRPSVAEKARGDAMKQDFPFLFNWRHAAAVLHDLGTSATVGPEPVELTLCSRCLLEHRILFPGLRSKTLSVTKCGGVILCEDHLWD